MTIINAIGSLPGLGRLMLNRVICSGKTERAELFDYLLPGPVRSGDKPFSNLDGTLTALKDAGLFQEKDGSISTQRNVNEFAGGNPLTPQRFRRLLQRSIFGSIDDPWIMTAGDTLTTGAKDLNRTLSWFLAQNVLSTFTWEGKARGFLSADLVQRNQLLHAESLRPFSNDARWGTFTRWSVAVGMAEPALSGTGLHPDATVAIRDVTQEMTPGNHSIDEFLGVLTKQLPVISGGVLHSSFLNHAQSNPDPDGAAGLLDTTIAQAILCLEEEELVTIMPIQADASSRTIGLGPTRRRVTHIRVNETVSK